MKIKQCDEITHMKVQCDVMETRPKETKFSAIRIRSAWSSQLFMRIVGQLC